MTTCVIGHHNRTLKPAALLSNPTRWMHACLYWPMLALDLLDWSKVESSAPSTTFSIHRSRYITCIRKETSVFNLWQISFLFSRKYQTLACHMAHRLERRHHSDRGRSLGSIPGSGWSFSNKIKNTGNGMLTYIVDLIRISGSNHAAESNHESRPLADWLNLSPRKW